jgi:hypothetical protein
LAQQGEGFIKPMNMSILERLLRAPRRMHGQRRVS